MDREVPLPPPNLHGGVSVEGALGRRRSVRRFSGGALSLDHLTQLLWAAQGITKPMEEPLGTWPWGEWRGGLRTAPSAGALYPLEVYVVAGRVEGLDPALYRYLARTHSLAPSRAGELRPALYAAVHRQEAVRSAPVSIVLAAELQRTEIKYGERAERYVHMEVGAAVQNICLQAAALGLGTVFIGAFEDDRVHEVLGLSPGHLPLAVVPVGWPDRT